MTTAGAGAAAGALTGFVGSSVGAAAVIGGFGAGGAHAVGSRMARRLGACPENPFLKYSQSGQQDDFVIVSKLLCECMDVMTG